MLSPGDGILSVNADGYGFAVVLSVNERRGIAYVQAQNGQVGELPIVLAMIAKQQLDAHCAPA